MDGSMCSFYVVVGGSKMSDVSESTSNFKGSVEVFDRDCKFGDLGGGQENLTINMLRG